LASAIDPLLDIHEHFDGILGIAFSNHQQGKKQPEELLVSPLQAAVDRGLLGHQNLFTVFLRTEGARADEDVVGGGE
jgi:hypothetical protein